MKKRSWLIGGVLLATLGCPSGGGVSPEQGVVSDPGSQPPPTALLQTTHLTYLGAFRLPQGQLGASSFDYGGQALAFHASQNSLFMVGHPYQTMVAEISIPTPVQSSSLADLPIAALLQSFGDVTGGKLAASEADTMGGLLVHGGKLLWTIYEYYDADTTNPRGHGISSMDLSSPGAQGPFPLTVPSGRTAGYLCAVPPAWQDDFGVPVLCGLAGTPIVSRTSVGPIAVGIDPAKFGTGSPAPAEEFLGYTLQNRYAPWPDGSWTLNGGAFPIVNEKSALLLFGREGKGEVWYGPGSLHPERNPCNDYSGYHDPPYKAVVWYYDPQELLKVKSGQKQPWELVPYAKRVLSKFYPQCDQQPGGVAYGPATRRVYVVQIYADSGAYPVVHVYEVKGD